MGAGHCGVDLGKYDPRCVDCCSGGIDRCPECAEAVAIGGRKLHNCRIEPHLAAGKEAGDVREKNRHEISVAFIDHRAQARAGEERDRPQLCSVRGIGKRHGPFQVKVPEPHVFQIAAPSERL